MFASPIRVFTHPIPTRLLCQVVLAKPLQPCMVVQAVPWSWGCVYVPRHFLRLNPFFLLRGAAAWSVRRRCLKHNTNVFLKSVEIPRLGSQWSVSVTPRCHSFLSPCGWAVKANPSPIHPLLARTPNKKQNQFFKNLFPEVSVFILYYFVGHPAKLAFSKSTLPFIPLLFIEYDVFS